MQHQTYSCVFRSSRMGGKGDGREGRRKRRWTFMKNLYRVPCLEPRILGIPSTAHRGTECCLPFLDAAQRDLTTYSKEKRKFQNSRQIRVCWSVCSLWPSNMHDKCFYSPCLFTVKSLWDFSKWACWSQSKKDAVKAHLLIQTVSSVLRPSLTMAEQPHLGTGRQQMHRNVCRHCALSCISTEKNQMNHRNELETSPFSYDRKNGCFGET